MTASMIYVKGVMLQRDQEAEPVDLADIGLNHLGSARRAESETGEG